MPPTQTLAEDRAKSGNRSGVGKTLVIGCVVAVIVTFVAMEIVTLLAEQKTEAQRRGIAMVGGRSETEREVPDWLQSIAGPEFHSFFDRTKLLRVKLSDEKVGDAELAKVGGLPDIRALDLSGSNITNAGLKTVAELKTLRFLNLKGTKVSDVTPLAELPSLESLNLSFSELREDEFETLTRFPNLQSLSAAGLMITDQGVALLAKCPHLKELNINGAILTETGLRPLQVLKGLTFLSIKESTYNSADVAALKQALPDCEVVQ